MDKLSLVLKYLAGAVLIGILSFFTYAGKISADVLVAVITAVFGGLGVHVAGRYSTAEPPVSGDPKQGGFVQPYLLGVLAAISCLCLIAACATTSSTTTTDDSTTTVTTPDLTSVCKNTQSALTVISAVVTAYDDGTAQTISNASTVVADLCTAGGSVDAKSIATLAQTTIPDLITLVKGLDIDTTTKATALAALAVAQMAINTIVTQLDASTTTSAAARAVLHPLALKIHAAQGAK
jgi:hypothetical protein